MCNVDASKCPPSEPLYGIGNDKLGNNQIIPILILFSIILENAVSQTCDRLAVHLTWELYRPRRDAIDGGQLAGSIAVVIDVVCISGRIGQFRAEKDVALRHRERVRAPFADFLARGLLARFVVAVPDDLLALFHVNRLQRHLCARRIASEPRHRHTPDRAHRALRLVRECVTLKIIMIVA